MSFELKFNTGLSNKRLDTLIRKLEKIATLSDKVSKKQVGPGVKFPQAGGVGGGTEKGTVTAIAALNTSITRLTAVISSGTGRTALRGAGGKPKALAESHVKTYKEEMKSIKKLDDLRLLALNNNIKAARQETKIRLQEEQKKHAAYAKYIGQKNQLTVKSAKQVAKEAQRESKVVLQAEHQKQRAFLKSVGQKNKATVKSAKLVAKEAQREAKDVLQAEQQKHAAFLRRIGQKNKATVLSAKLTAKAARTNAVAEAKAQYASTKADNKATAQKIKNVAKVEAANKKASASRKHEAAVQAAAAARAGLYASGVGIGLFTAKTILAAGAAYALVSALRAIIGAGANFTEAMARTNAVMGANAEMASTSAAAVRELAKDTVFTATQAAEGLTYLAMAGLKGHEALEALPGTLNLASIGMIDMAQAADMATNVMNEFGMRSSDLNDIVNSMAYAVTSSNTTIQQLGSALSYVGPIAHATNTTLNETIAMISTMADSGIKGTRAGTALRRSISNLLSPTKKVREELNQLNIGVRDSYDEMRSMVDIMRDLAEATDDVGVLTRIFGVRAAPGMIAVWVDLKKETKGLTPELVKLKKAMDNLEGTKFGENMRKDIEDHLKGDWMKVVAAAEETALKFFAVFEEPLRNALKEFASFLNENAEDWATWADKVARATSKVGGLVEGLYDLALGDPLQYLFGEEDKGAYATALERNRNFINQYDMNMTRFTRMLGGMEKERIANLVPLTKRLLDWAEFDLAQINAKSGVEKIREQYAVAEAKVESLRGALAAIQVRSASLEVIEKKGKEEELKPKRNVFLEEQKKHLEALAVLEKGSYSQRVEMDTNDYNRRVQNIENLSALEEIKAVEAANQRQIALNEHKENVRAILKEEITALKTVTAEKAKALAAVTEGRDPEKIDARLYSDAAKAHEEARSAQLEKEYEYQTKMQELAGIGQANWQKEKLRYKEKVKEAEEFNESIRQTAEKEREKNAIISANIATMLRAGEAIKQTANQRIRATIAAKEHALATLEEKLALEGTSTAANAARLSIQKHIIDTKAGIKELQQVLADREALQQQHKHIKEIVSLGKKGAESLKSAFAEFLFNPFDKGLKGMVLGFASAVHKMVTEAVAARLIDSLFQGATGSSASGFLGNLLIPLLGGSAPTAPGPAAAPSMAFGAWGGGMGLPKANGGAVLSNRIYPVNERETEMLSMGGKDYLMTGKQSGEVTPSDNGNKVIKIYNTVTIKAEGGQVSRESIKNLQTALGKTMQKSMSRNG